MSSTRTRIFTANLRRKFGERYPVWKAANWRGRTSLGDGHSKWADRARTCDDITEHNFAQLTGRARGFNVFLHGWNASVYQAISLGPGDEVIVPAQTHTATAHAVEPCGGRAIFVDAERETGNIDIAAIEGAITERTKAIAIVHYLGVCVDMDKVIEIAKASELFVLEDCALAIGTHYNGTHVGLLGDAGCYSFYPSNT